MEPLFSFSREEQVKVHCVKCAKHTISILFNSHLDPGSYLSVSSFCRWSLWNVGIWASLHSWGVVTGKSVPASRDYRSPLFGYFICPPSFKFPYGSPFAPRIVTEIMCLPTATEIPCQEQLCQGQDLLPESINKPGGNRSGRGDIRVGSFAM